VLNNPHAMDLMGEITRVRFTVESLCSHLHQNNIGVIFEELFLPRSDDGVCTWKCNKTSSSLPLVQWWDWKFSGIFCIGLSFHQKLVECTLHCFTKYIGFIKKFSILVYNLSTFTVHRQSSTKPRAHIKCKHTWPFTSLKDAKISIFRDKNSVFIAPNYMHILNK
jgi:hypothetical protein